MFTTENFSKETFQPAHFESQGSIELGGKIIPYHTVSEDNVFYSKSGEAVATIFSYSYFRSDVKKTDNRPVLFGFNGGPGFSSTFVHTGFLGVKRVRYGEPTRPNALPPYEAIDNPECLLDIADIVIVDPVGTGYGMLLDDACADKFFGLEPDAEALLIFIERWLHRYNRWTSPKFLIGESYGCTRAAIAAGMASFKSTERCYNIAFDGIVLIGNTVSVGKYFNRDVPVEPSVLSFPTYAAINWYHNHPSQQSLNEFIAEAKEFADSEYLLALYRDESMSQEERQAVSEKIHYYTGASLEYIRSHGMRFDDPSYRSDVIKDKGLAVSRFDARITRPLYRPEVTELSEGKKDDATSDLYSPLFRGVMNGVVFPMLNIHLERSYIPSYSMVHPVTGEDKWNREETMGTTAQQLRRAMYRTQGMRVFFAGGWFDMATYYGIVDYTLNHGGFPLDRICRKGYPSGHMIYFGEDNVKELCGDIRRFILGEMPSD